MRPAALRRNPSDFPVPPSWLACIGIVSLTPIKRQVKEYLWIQYQGNKNTIECYQSDAAADTPPYKLDDLVVVLLTLTDSFGHIRSNTQSDLPELSSRITHDTCLTKRQTPAIDEQERTSVAVASFWTAHSVPEMILMIQAISSNRGI